MLKLTDCSGKPIIINKSDLKLLCSHGDKTLLYIKRFDSPFTVTQSIDEIESMMSCVKDKNRKKMLNTELYFYLLKYYANVINFDDTLKINRDA